MMDHFADNHGKSPQASQWIDLADLTSIVASLKGPDRHVDAIIDAMLAGKGVVRTLTLANLKDSQWLSDESPAFTAGGSPLRVLLQRRGVKAHAAAVDGGFTTTMTDPFTGLHRQATAVDETVSTLLALLHLESARNGQ